MLTQYLVFSMVFFVHIDIMLMLLMMIDSGVANALS